MLVPVVPERRRPLLLQYVQILVCPVVPMIETVNAATNTQGSREAYDVAVVQC